MLYSQNGTLTGRITDENNKPLVGGHIHSNAIYVNSNSEGFYTLNNLSSGPQKVEFSYVGYKTIDTLVTIQGNTVLNISLVLDRAQLAEVTIKDQVIRSTTTTTAPKLKTETIEQYSGASLGDLLKEVSGVSALKTGSSVVKPVINGLHSSRVLIINNNVRLEDQQWGAEHAPNFDVNAAGEITVIKGAAGLQYGGDAVGGTVVIEPQHIPVMDTIYGKTILNGSSNGRGGSISSSLTKSYQSGWNWNVLGTFKYLGDVSAPDYVLSNTGNRAKNFSGSFGYKGTDYGFSANYSYTNSEIGILRASHIGNISDLVRAINSQQPQFIADRTYNIGYPKQEVQHHLAKINFYKNFSGFGKLNVQYAFQRNERLEYDIRRGQNRDNAALDLTLTTHAVNLDFVTEEKGNYIFKFGTSGSYQKNFANPGTNVRPLIPNYDKYDFGVYGISTYKANDNLTLEAGLRYDYSKINATKYYLKSRWNERGYSQDFSSIIVGDFDSQWLTKPEFTYHNFSGTLGAKYQINTGLSLYTNVSLANRSPNPSELFSDGLHHSLGIIELGDLRLKKEKALKLSTTLSHRSDRFTFDINPYINFINDFMIIQPTGLEYTNRGAFPVWEYSQVDARLFGIDVNTTWNYSDKFSQSMAVSYVYGKDLDKNRPLIDMPPLNWVNTISYKNKNWHHLMLSLKNENVFTQQRYPNNDFYADVIVNGSAVSTLVNISKPPKGYSLFHFNSEVSFNALTASKITVGFNIQNIFNTNYRDYLNRQRFYADEIGRNFSIQLKFNY